MSNNKISNLLKPFIIHQKNKFYSTTWFKILIIVLLFLIIVFFTLGLIYYKPVRQAYKLGLEGKNNFLLAQNFLIAQDFESANINLNKAIGDFESAQVEIKKFNWLRFIPYLGVQIKAIDKLIAAGISTGQSIKQINEIALNIITPLKKNNDISLGTLSESETEQLLRETYDSKPSFEQAKKTIDIAVQIIDEIPRKGLIKKIKEVILPLQEKIPQLQSGIDQAISISQILPSIAGYPENKTYLFLLQNNTELRPTGGFIGTYGILKIENGDIKSFNTDNSYNLDKPAEAWLNETPPWPLTRYNKVFQWFFRDSNWSPDFPTSAQKAEWFYHQEHGQEKNIDGIIAVTPTFIQSLLNITGDIKVNGLTFNSDNLVDTLQYQVEQGFLRQNLPESERKEIIGTLSKKILDAVLALPKSKWPKLWEILNKDITEKQILFYIKDGYIQNLIEKENWGGKINNVDYDYFTIIDANLASLKSDPGVKRTISYTLNRADNNLIADLNINYRNEGTVTWKTTRYRSFVRVYVPAGSTLLKSSGAMVDCKISNEGSIETVDELNKVSFGLFICIEPGEEKNLFLKYKLPDRIAQQFNSNSYKLLIQKQSGTSDYPLKIDLKLKKKPNKIILENGVDTIQNHDISINSILTKDTLITAEF